MTYKSFLLTRGVMLVLLQDVLFPFINKNYSKIYLPHLGQEDTIFFAHDVSCTTLDCKQIIHLPKITFTVE